VGKSTLFNRLLGLRKAIVAEEPGVTRDRLVGVAEWGGRSFQLVDTGGLVPRAREALIREIEAQVRAAIAAADLVLLVVDFQQGLSPIDHEIASWLRKREKPVLLAVNKVDRWEDRFGLAEFHALGLGSPWPVSALQGKGSGDLLDEVVHRLPVREEAPEEEGAAVRVAVLGKPNVGKSSLVNRSWARNG